MNKLRLDAQRMKRWGLAVSVAVLAFAYVNMRNPASIMTAVTTRELPVYNVDTNEKVLSISFDAAWGRANTRYIKYIGSVRCEDDVFSGRLLGRKTSGSGGRTCGQRP